MTSRKAQISLNQAIRVLGRASSSSTRVGLDKASVTESPRTAGAAGFSWIEARHLGSLPYSYQRPTCMGRKSLADGQGLNAGFVLDGQERLLNDLVGNFGGHRRQDQSNGQSFELRKLRHGPGHP